MLLTVSQPYNSGDLNSGGSQDLENSFKNQDGFENFPLDNHSLFESPTETPNKSTCQIITLKILDSHTLAIFMSFVTIYALFSDDIRIAACTKEDDDVFYALSTIALFFFLLDLIASTIVKQDYRFSFYFWLDLLSTLSTVPDIGWVWDPLVDINSEGDGGSDQVKHTKSANSGTKASRVIRVIKLIRLIRIVKLYKNAKIAMRDDDNGEVNSEIDTQIPSESRVGKKLSDLTIKRVVILVLILLTLLPLFNLDFFLSPLTSWEFGIRTIEEFLGEDDVDIIRNEYLAYHKHDTRPLIYLNYTYNGEIYKWESDTNSDDLRYTEKHVVKGDYSYAIIDIRHDTKLDSILNICKTIFVCIVLLSGALSFTKDADDLVVIPIENMVRKIKKIARNPLNAGQISAENQSINAENKKFLCFKRKVVKAEYETTLLENTILKIGALLALGFGEAGSKIIATNIEKGGDVDPVLQGTKIGAIYGFCDIRNFTDTTEELQEGVMVFVNEIAYIVHTVVDQLLGAANKNIGDAFLMVWKFDDEDVLELSDPLVLNPESKRAKYLADLALLSFLKIIAKINKDPNILKYRSNFKLLKRMPNYEVKIGFGLHAGWSIEGAIGSEFKIDASYLSPHVNMASRLEASTKQYGVPLLLSGAIFDILSPKVKNYCRHIDTIMIKGNQNPLLIYTSDVDTDNCVPGDGLDKSKEQTNKLRKSLKAKLDRGQIDSCDLFKDSREIALLREGITEEFLRTFDEAMNFYQSGDWDSAKMQFEVALKLRPNDGPSKTLLLWIKESNCLAPADWAGIRILTEK